MFELTINHIHTVTVACPTQFIINCTCEGHEVTILTHYRNSIFKAAIAEGKYDEKSFPSILLCVGASTFHDANPGDPNYISLGRTTRTLERMGYKFNNPLKKFTVDDIRFTFFGCDLIGVYELNEIYNIYVVDSNDKVVAVFDGCWTDDFDVEFVTTYDYSDVGRKMADIVDEISDGGIIFKHL